MTRRNFAVAAALVLLLVVAGYIHTQGPQSDTYPDSARFGNASLKVEFATTTAERQLGLGNRTAIPDGYGMLFVFPDDGYYGFWMKDTLVPLDMFWLDSKGQVVSYYEDVEPSTYPDVFYPSMPARYVLETRAGFRQAHAIATGTPLVLKNLPTVSE